MGLKLYGFGTEPAECPARCDGNAEEEEDDEDEGGYVDEEGTLAPTVMSRSTVGGAGGAGGAGAAGAQRGGGRYGQPYETPDEEDDSESVVKGRMGAL